MAVGARPQSERRRDGVAALSRTAQHRGLGETPDPEERKLLMADQTVVDEWRWPEPPHQPLSWYFELHDRIRARTLESVRRWPPAETAIEWDGRPRTLRWVMGHVIQHEAYHGGQAVLLSRLWDMKA